MLASMSRKPAGLPDISRPTSKPSRHAELLLHVRRVSARARSRRASRPSCSASSRRYGIHVGNHGVARAGVPRHRRRHDADGSAPVTSTSSPSTGNESAVCTALPKGSKMAATSSRYAFVVAPDVGHRQRDIFGERARPVHAHAHGVRAQVAPSGETVAAAAADHVAFAADHVAREEVGHVGAHLDNPRRRTRGRSPWAREWSSAPTRPICKCARRCRRCRSAAL